MTKHILSILLVTTCFLTSCADSKPKTEAISNGTAKADAAKETNLVGNDKDEHGCIASAGYVWSAVKGNCVRLFEVDHTELISSSKTEHQNSVAMLIFDDSKSKVETFLPNGNTILLSKKSDGIWMFNAYELQEKKGYRLLENGNEIFRSK